jgi:hypothetical protein
MGFESLSLMSLKSLKYSSTVLLGLLLFAIAHATAALVLFIEIDVKFLRGMRMASNSLCEMLEIRH